MSTYQNPNLLCLIEDQLYWCPSSVTDNIDRYEIFEDHKVNNSSSFYGEYNPWDLGLMYDFFTALDSRRKRFLTSPNSPPLLIHESPNKGKNTNNILSICFYLMVAENNTPQQAFDKFQSHTF